MKNEWTSLILGAGEVGLSLQEILSTQYVVRIFNEHQQPEDEKFEIMHICFPYSDKFEDEVKRYQEKYKPKFTVIHSTVPPGTSRRLNSIHSPIIGIHPHLEQSIKTFVKYLSGDQASEVADYFRRAGLKVYLFDKQETTELLKIMDTTFYGVCLEYTKEVKTQCDKLGVPFEAWTVWTEQYNQGYKKLGYPEFTRPNLVPIQKRLGGHCVLQNTELLDNDFTSLIKKRNEEIS